MATGARIPTIPQPDRSRTHASRPSWLLSGGLQTCYYSGITANAAHNVLLDVRRRCLLAAALCLAAARLGRADGFDERIKVPVLVNGQKASLVFDTGAPISVLYRTAAVRLGVKFVESAPDEAVMKSRKHGEQWVNFSEPFQLALGQSNVSVSFGILDVDPAMKMDSDGILSWNNLQFKVLQIDAAHRRVGFPDQLPDGVTHWPHWKLVDKSWNEMMSAWLGIQIPTVNGRLRSAIYFDTGSDEGVRVCSRRLAAWKSVHPGAPATWKANYFPGLTDGLVIREEYWASRLDLADQLEVSSVPISSCAPSEEAAESYEAALGLFALSRLEVVVDGVARLAYIRPATGVTNAYSYKYNRIGAVFAPRDIAGDDLIGHVIKGGPAYEAGVRDGDVLVKIGELDATKWKTDPRVLPLSRFWSQPAGTKIDIECRRGDTALSFTIRLKEIFPIETSAPGKSP